MGSAYRLFKICFPGLRNLLNSIDEYKLHQKINDLIICFTQATLIQIILTIYTPEIDDIILILVVSRDLS